MNERDRLQRNREALDSDPGTPGVQQGLDEFAAGYDAGRMIGKLDIALWLIIGATGGALAAIFARALGLW